MTIAPAAARPLPDLAGYAAVLLGATAIGFSPIFFRLSEMGPASAAFWRMVFALPFVWAWMRVAERRQPAAASRTLGPGAFGLAVIAGLGFAADNTSFNMALMHTTAAKAGLLCNLAPIFVVAAVWAMGERPGRATLLALGLAVLGAGLLVAPSDRAGAGQEGWGDILALASAVFYAVYIVATGAAQKAGLPAARVTFLSTLVCAGACLLAALAMGETLLPVTLTQWAALLALGLIAHALGQGLTAVALGRIPASSASIALIWNAVVTAIAAALLYAEIPTALQVAGGALVLVGIALVRPR